MSRIRNKDTGIELLVFGRLRRAKIHFHRHYRRAPGTPDIALPKRKIAVFVDGDFWHGWRYPSWRGKLPSKFWRDKIERNRARDRRNFAKLRRQGWRVLRVWEHDLAGDLEGSIKKIVAFISNENAGS